jgi:long-chain acyl-CoA synthetase
LLQFPDVVEVAVLGIPDETLGEAVSVFVVPKAASDETLEQRFLAFAGERLPPQLVPKRVERLAALPKNNAGKVLRPALRARLEMPDG